MKIHLPTTLRSALLACLAALPCAQAATFLAEGVDRDDLSASTRFYDGGKGSYWKSSDRIVYDGAHELYEQYNSFAFLGELADRLTPEQASTFSVNSFANLILDGQHCWAYTSSNLLEYWQSYYGVFASDPAKLTYGYTYDKANLDKLGGTQSLRLNMLFYDNCRNKGDFPQQGLAWYLKGTEWDGLNAAHVQAGAFSAYFSGDHYYNYAHVLSGDSGVIDAGAFAGNLKQLFGCTQAADGSLTQATKGQLVHLKLQATDRSAHAITCYGFETDGAGNIASLYVVNSDDQKYELIKLDVRKGDDGYVLYQDGLTWGYAGKKWQIIAMSAIDTPQQLRDMLAEYEGSALRWTGGAATWSLNATTEALPTAESGWTAHAGSNTPQAGDYASYFSAGREVRFDDSAASGVVQLGGDVQVAAMTVDNSALAYRFEGAGHSIEADSFLKQGSAPVEFDHVLLKVGSVSIEGDVTFDRLDIAGVLHANGNTITLTEDSSLHVIDAGSREPVAAVSSLIVTGGTTQVNTSNLWTNLRMLEISDAARLKFNASVHVDGGITSVASTEAHVPGSVVGLETRYCIGVGNVAESDWGRNSLDAAYTITPGSGNVELAGEMATSEAYMHIMGNVDVRKVGGELGNVRAGSWMTIRGNATVEGNVSSKGDLAIGGEADVGGDLGSASGSVTLRGGGRVGGTVSGSGITLGGDSSFGHLNTTGRLVAQGHTVTLMGDSRLACMDTGRHAGPDPGTSSLIITSGTAAFSTKDEWTNLRALALSPQARLSLLASVSVAGDITTCDATGTLAGNTNAGVASLYCIKVGSQPGTGNVTLAGNIVSHNAYIDILGDARITPGANTDGSLSSADYLDIGGQAEVAGSVSSSGSSVRIGGDATVGGSVSAKGDITVGGRAEVAGDVSSQGGTLTLAQGGHVGGTAKAESIRVGGDLHDTTLQARSISIGGEDTPPLTLDSVDIELLGSDSQLTNVTVSGRSRFSSATAHTLHVQDVTFVLDTSNSEQREALDAQPLTLGRPGLLGDAPASPAGFHIGSSLLDGVSLDGAVRLDLSHWADQIQGGGHDQITLSFAPDTSFADTATVHASLDGVNYTQAHHTEGNRAMFGVLSATPAAAIPEPATATLALLALAALTARRRREG